MTTKLLGRGFGIALTVLTVVGVPSMAAYADATCYTGCTPPIQTGPGGGHGGGGSGATRPPVTKPNGGSRGSSGTGGSSGSSGANARTTSQSSSSSGGALPFTGADIEQMTIGGAGVLLLGGVLVRRSRNRRRLQA